MKYIAIHHSAVSYTKNPDQWDATNTYHKKTFNMKSSLGFYVGYNYEISMLGVCRQARVVGEETAAVKGHNKDTISICLDGNFDIEKPTSAQMDSLGKLLVELVDKYKIPVYNIVPHRALQNYEKSCYGSLLKDNWGQLVYQLANAKNLLAKLLALLKLKVA